MKKIILTISTFTFCLALHNSFAAMPKSSGFYIDGNAGYGYVDEEVSNATKDDKEGVGLNANAGYKFNNNFAVEAGAARYPNEDFGTATGKYNFAALFLAKGIIPFDNGFDIFGKAGAAVVHHKFNGKYGNTYSGEGSNTATTAYLGLGAGYAFTPNWEGTIQANTTVKNGNVPGMRMLAVGFIYMY